MTPEQWETMKPYFTKEEFLCPCCGEEYMDYDFMLSYRGLREECGFPFPVNSGFRCGKNETNHDRDPIDGAHPRGEGVDTGVWGKQNDTMIRLSYKHGFTGRGIKQKGKYNTRYNHLDKNSSEEKFRPTMWSY